MPADALLDVRALTKSYRGLRVLDTVDLAVPRGSITAVLGPSGAGKTTLLRVVAGFEDADAGTVTLAGRTLVDGARSVPAERRRIGIVPQEGALFPHLTVGGNVGFGLPRGSRARVDACLELVGLPGMAARRPDELSGGQQQRVALARALAPEPPLVVFDEPFSSLDASLRAEVREDVMSALRRAGVTALLVTHDQQEALAVADQVVVLLAGRVAQAGGPEEVYRRPTSLAVARFVGESIVVPVGARGASALGPLATDGRGAVAVVRPEQLVLGDPPEPGADGARATLVAARFLGHEALVTLRLADGCEVRARMHATTLPHVGATVGVAVAGPVTTFLAASDDAAAPDPTEPLRRADQK